MNENETVKTEQKKKDKLKYLITGIVFLVIALAFMWNDGIFEKESVKEVMGSISNGFFITGGLFAGVGALSFIGSKGTYDTLSYGVSKIGIHHLIPGMPRKDAESFYDYKVAKDKKGRVWFPNLLFVGLAGILLSVVFVVLYSFL
ncbi:MAG: DUF3899 domain-containing protein [Lachnospiraceae bacterium]|nr:DUF3899 domain-containing protein [Lachnospiraceae bacterium]